MYESNFIGYGCKSYSPNHTKNLEEIMMESRMNSSRKTIISVICLFVIGSILIVGASFAVFVTTNASITWSQEAIHDHIQQSQALLDNHVQQSEQRLDNYIQWSEERFDDYVQWSQDLVKDVIPTD